MILAIVGMSAKKKNKRVRELKNELKKNKGQISNVKEQQDKVVRRKKDIAQEIKKGVKDINEAKQNKPKIKKMVK